MIIATNPDSHYKILTYAIKKIHNIICEKPFRFEKKKKKNILRLVKDKKLNLYINYSRRFSKPYEKLKKDIILKKYGKLLKINVKTSKGLINSGSHYIDFIRYVTNRKFIVDKAIIKKSSFLRNDYYGKIYLRTKSIFASIFVKDIKSKLIEEINLDFENYLIEINDNKFIKIKNKRLQKKNN